METTTLELQTMELSCKPCVDFSLLFIWDLYDREEFQVL